MAHLYKHDNGNLCFLAVTTDDEEKRARGAGFKLLDELYPSAPTDADFDAIALEDKARKATRKGRA